VSLGASDLIARAKVRTAKGLVVWLLMPELPRALEVLDHAVRQLERGETSALEVIDTLFAEELTLRENRRVKMALRMAKLDGNVRSFV
jgi:hypothetical protein